MVTSMLVVGAPAWFASGWRKAECNWVITPTTGICLDVRSGVIDIVLRKSIPIDPGVRFVLDDYASVSRAFKLPEWRWHFRFFRNEHWTIVTIPIWSVYLAATVCSVWLWRTDRRIPGHCPHCHYDLRSSPPGPCPECGRDASLDLKKKAEEARASSA